MPEKPSVEPSFAALLRRYRRAAGLTQEQLAERAGISARAVSDLERDNGRVPRRDSVDLLAGALGLAADERSAMDQARAAAQPKQETSPTRAAPEQKGVDTLPAQPTPFIGREREIAAVRGHLLDPETRLLTITGPGGIGKTRLALQVAAAVRDRFPDGIVFVALAAITDPRLMLSIVARALGVEEKPGQDSVETLSTVLGGKRLLLLLDNFEQILPAATDVADLLAAVPGLMALTTSRAALHLRGERLHQVVPLAVPTPPLPSLEALSQYEAVRLFIARARDVQPDFAVTNETAPAVAEICARLDGLPLAIELVAARTRLLSPNALLARLGERLRVATGGARDLPDRQRTLRAAIDWSYSLLEPVEQVLFARLAVFSGGCTVEAIEAVCDIGGDLGIEVVNGVESLLDKSLLRQEESLEGERRLVMLETIHEYARARLVASAEQAALERIHAHYYLALAEEADPKLTGPQQVEWLARLATEHDNLRAVLRWATGGAGDPAVGVSLAGIMCRFWQMRGHFSEGLSWLELALGHEGSNSTVSRAKALTAAGSLANALSDYPRAATRLREGLALSRGLKDRRGSADALRALGVTASAQGDYAQAAALLGEGLELYRDLGDTRGTAAMLTNLGLIASYYGDYVRAATLWEEGLAFYRELGDRAGIAWILSLLGVTATDQGEYPRAIAFYEESLALSRRIGDRQGMAGTLLNLGVIAANQSDYAYAMTRYGEGLALSRAMGDRRHISWTLLNMGGAAAEQGDYARAAALLDEGLALCRALGDRRGAAATLFVSGRVAFEQGDRARAMARYVESLSLGQEVGYRLNTADALEGIATVRTNTGHVALAARLFGAADALRRAIGVPLQPYARQRYDGVLADLRDALGEEALAAARLAGEAISLDDAVALALAPAHPIDE